MALVRVYCGVAAAEMAPWLTVAVVDDSGRLLDMRHISDDPAGYAYLGALLADRSGGSAPVAMDRHDHLVAQLLAAANRPLAIADEASLADFAERFSDDSSYDETQAPQSQRAAVGLARALQAGALYATAQSPSWNLDEFKPVLAAHGAVTAGRQAAAAALREVLRELYPAALRAYPDPAEYVPLKILDALPEPSLLTASPASRNRESALVAELSSTGVADNATAVAAITALRVAVEESPRWNASRAFAPVVAETVKQAVAAVRACDAASAALIGTLVERLGALTGTPAAPARPYLVQSAPVSPASSRQAPAAEVPLSRLAARAGAANGAAAGLPIPSQRGSVDYADPASYGQPPSRTPYPQHAEPAYPSSFAEPAAFAQPPSFAEPPPFQSAPGYNNGYQEQTGGYQEQNGSYPDNGGYSDPAAYAGRHDGPSHADPRFEEQSRRGDAQFAESGYPEPRGRRAAANGTGSYAQVSPAAPPTGPSWPAAEGSGSWPPVESTGSWPPVESSGSWPAVDGANDEIAAVYAGLPAGAARANGEPGAHGAAFNIDPLTAPMRGGPATPAAPARAANNAAHAAESPGLRLVENPGLDPLTGPMATVPPPALRVIDGGRHIEPPPNPVAEDTDLLIFSQTQSNSAWFILADADAPTTEDPPTWGHLADEGWRAAEQLSSPSVGAATTAGLPRRVPQANLVPGSTEEPPRQLRIVRDPQSIAAHTSGYFRGWQRGQEIGGYAVGQRDRAAWEFNREQRARETEDQRARLS